MFPENGLGLSNDLIAVWNTRQTDYLNLFFFSLVELLVKPVQQISNPHPSASKGKAAMSLGVPLRNIYSLILCQGVWEIKSVWHKELSQCVWEVKPSSLTLLGKGEERLDNVSVLKLSLFSSSCKELLGIKNRSWWSLREMYFQHYNVVLKHNET